MYYFIYWFSIFMIYSFGGWIIETIVMSYSEKKIVNRGFLLGPYLPVYGVAGLLMSFLLQFCINYPIFLFLNAILIGSLLEYFTSYMMEKLFKAKWWDYSHLPFHLNGRICLQNSILFGLLGSIVIYFINPFLYFCIDSIPVSLLYFIAGLLISLFIIDCIVSCNIITQLKMSAVALKKDYTEEMSSKVLEVLKEKGWTFKRILNAFPNLTFQNMKGFKKVIQKQATQLKKLASSKKGTPKEQESVNKEQNEKR